MSEVQKLDMTILDNMSLGMRLLEKAEAFFVTSNERLIYVMHEICRLYDCMLVCISGYLFTYLSIDLCISTL